MAGMTPSDPDSLEPFLEWKNEVDRQLRVLQRPSGTQTAGLLAQVQAAIATIGATVTAYLVGGFSTGSMIASGSISAGGNISATGRVTGAAGMTSVGVYNQLLTYGGLYSSQYVHQDGTMGYVPSSRRFKQDIEGAEIEGIRSLMRKIRVVTFRYIAAVESTKYEAAIEWGVIAEEIHDLGLYWLVDYDAEGQPHGVKHERFATLLILDSQDKQRQIDALTKRMEAAGI